MGANTNIEWPDHTFNPWDGCTKVSPACDHCYAEARNARFGGGQAINWGPGAPRRRTSEANWKLPLKWNRKAANFMQCPTCSWRGQWEEADKRMGCCPQCGSLPKRFIPTRPRVFCASIADVFDNAVPAQWRADLWALIRSTPAIDWLLLTKRIGNAASMLYDDDEPLPNVWIGATICNQQEADRDIPKLLAVPAVKRFLSVEPLLGPVDLAAAGGFWSDMNGKIKPEYQQFRRHLDWVIVGGESGPNARPMHPDWARSLRDQCQEAGVPFLFKQWGEWCPRGPESLGYPSVDSVPRLRMTDAGHNGQDLASDGGNDVWMHRAGKKTAGRMLDGRPWDEVPA